MDHPDIQIIDRPGGGQSVVITLPDVLGVEAATLADWFDTVLWALANLRSGEWGRNQSPDTVREIGDAIGHLETKLSPRLAGLRDALIRAHQLAGGSHGALALAMDAPRSTAQSRSQRLQPVPSYWESWAAGTIENPKESCHE